MKEELPPTTELEESFTNGVTLAKLANFFAPKVVPLRKIYDKDLKRYEVVLCHISIRNIYTFFVVVTPSLLQHFVLSHDDCPGGRVEQRGVNSCI